MLTACVLTFLGVQAGHIIVRFKNVSHWAMLKRWITWGLVLSALGTALCGGTQNDGILPLNKNLWSPSFIIAMAGTGKQTIEYRLRQLNYVGAAGAVDVHIQSLSVR